MKDHRPLAVIGLMIGLAAGSIATIPALVLAVASAGVGRGTYSPASCIRMRCSSGYLHAASSRPL
jgi:hypothetical protein